MKKSSLITAILISLLLSSCSERECLKYEFGKIVEITNYMKYGQVTVVWENGRAEEKLYQYRPKQSDIGETYCRCVEYKNNN